MSTAAAAAFPRADGRRVARNTALLGAGNAIRLVLGLATTVMITDQLGTDYGLLLGAQRYTEFFRLIALYGINTLLVRGLAAGSEDAGLLLGSAVALRAVLSALCVATTMMAAATTGYLPDHQWLLWVFSVLSLAFVGVETMTSFCEGYERMDLTAWLPATRSIFMFLGAAAVAWLGGGLVGVAMVFVGTQVLQLFESIWLSRGLWRPLALRSSFAKMWELLRDGPHYMAIGLAYAALRSSSVMILTRFSTTEEVAMYGAALNFVDMLFLLPLLSQRAFLPAFSREGVESTELARQGLLAFSALLMPSAVGLAVLAESAVALYPSGSFAAAAPVLRIQALGVAFSCLSSIGTTFLTGRGRVGSILWSYAFSLPVQLLLCWLWVGEYGAVGVAAATVAAQGVFCLSTHVSTFGLGLRLPLTGILRHLLCSAAMALAIWPLRQLHFAIPAAVGAALYLTLLLAVSPAGSLEKRLGRALVHRARDLRR